MNIKKNKGQALFEFIIFLPFLMILYSLTLTLGGSINGSINQQKAVRGYFFSRSKNNAFLPTPNDLQELSVNEKVGMSFIGWREKSDGLVPVAPCYRMVPFTKPTNSEDCEESYPESQKTTQFIRVKSVFGVCSTTYHFNQGLFSPALNTPGMSVANREACEVK